MEHGEAHEITADSRNLAAAAKTQVSSNIRSQLPSRSKVATLIAYATNEYPPANWDKWRSSCACATTISPRTRTLEPALISFSRETKNGEGTMVDELTYLGLLNVVAITEWQAHQYLGRWLETTSDPSVRAALRVVVPARASTEWPSPSASVNLALRCASPPDSNFQAKLDFAGSNASDLEKWKRTGSTSITFPMALMSSTTGSKITRSISARPNYWVVTLPRNGTAFD